MFLSQLLNFLSGIVYLILHVTGGGTFPKALSAAQERECLQQMAQGSQSARQTLIAVSYTHLSRSQNTALETKKLTTSLRA